MYPRDLPERPNLDQYRKQAKELVKTVRAAGPEERSDILRHHPRRLTISHREPERFTLADAQRVIARENGFTSWPKFARYIEAITREYSAISRFEAAVDAVVTGDIATLGTLLQAIPGLIQERSMREHRSTLLHYVAANGVEDRRQRTAGNAPQIAALLLRAGADVDALAATYGGGRDQTPLNLVVSSIHPANADVQAALIETLLDHGAAINGLDDDGSPIRTAIAFHRLIAAETLARRGARIDSLVVAAGLGRDDLARNFLDRDRPEAPNIQLQRDAEIGLVTAAALGRLSTTETLLQRGVPAGAVDHRRWTALHWAAYGGDLETVDLLLRWAPPLEAENEFGATPLDQTIWATLHEATRPDHPAIIHRLRAAGAVVHPHWLDAASNRALDDRVVAALGQ